MSEMWGKENSRAGCAGCRSFPFFFPVLLHFIHVRGVKGCMRCVYVGGVGFLAWVGFHEGIQGIWKLEIGNCNLEIEVFDESGTKVNEYAKLWMRYVVLCCIFFVFFFDISSC